ncbi:MAG: S8 family serine peptidase, partial [Chloroflexi bacterium]|nr:S8 family serine peptidase [Chloroflexota bacterium]
MSTFRAKIRIVPQAILLVVLGFSLLFGGQVMNAAAGSSDFSWNLIRNSDGQTACTIQVTHEGEPTLEEITQICGSDIATGWQNGEYSFVQITSTPVPTATATAAVTATVVTKSWLDTPTTAAGLQTVRPLNYLAGKLIAAGYVDVSSCNGSALLVNGYASPCGLTAAMPYVYVWQNRFDELILNAAIEEQIPAAMFKNLLIQESQMWPQSSKHVPPEYGIGQLTENGTDTLLMWNNNFFKKICNQALEKEKCKKDYLSITASERAFLRGATLIQVRADCYNCSNNLDIKVAEKSISIFAAALKANFRQVDQIVKNLTGQAAINQMEWQEAWKLSAANYHAGPGCTSSAMRATLKERKPLRWKYISKNYEDGCTSAVDYVEHIITTGGDVELPTASQIEEATRIIYNLPAPTPTPTLTPLPTATWDGTASATPTVDPALTGTALPTIDLSVTPEIVPLIIDQSVAQQLVSPHIQDEVLLKIDPQHRAAVVAALEGLNVNLKRDGALVDSLDTLVVNLESAQLSVVLNTLKNNPGVEFIEPNYLVEMAGTPNDPGFSQQPNLWDIQVPQTWDALPSMQEVLVAVIDTGVDINHPDLANSIWQNAGEVGTDTAGADKKSNGIDDDGNGYVDDWQGWNMVSGNNDVNDNQGHGTQLAGIIGASVNNSLGIAGVAPNARILPVKILDHNGVGTYAQAAEGIVYATDMGARIINLGFGGTGSSELLQNAVNYALAHNVLVIAAGGNSGNATTYYPAGYPSVIAVSAVDSGMSWASFSSSGEHISLSAPGVGIYSTTAGGSFSTFSGTSMSSAQVSGVAALLAGQPQFSDVYTLRSALLGGAADLGAPGQDPFYGYGVVHAFDALAYIGPVLPTPTPWIVPTATADGGVIALASQDLWGASQSSTFAITSPANSIDKIFNDLTASSTGPFGSTTLNSWTFNAIDNTTLTAVASVDLDLRFYMTNWVNDTYYIQVFDNTNPACTFGWCTVYTLKFLPVTPIEGQPPSTLTTLTVPVTSVLNTVARVNAAQVRIAGSAVTGGSADNVTIFIDEVRLRVSDVLPPTATPTSTPAFIPTATLPASRWTTATPIAGEPHN